MGDAKQVVRSYRDLRVWQLAIDLAELVYEITEKFPQKEIYGLTSQMRRAGVSIASNIAEGNARQTSGEYLQFLGHSRGSLAELQTQTILASRLKLISAESGTRLSDLIDEVGRLLSALRNSITRRTRTCITTAGRPNSISLSPNP